MEENPVYIEFYSGLNNNPPILQTEYILETTQAVGKVTLELKYVEDLAFANINVFD